jgi:hypothetical protein
LAIVAGSTPLTTSLSPATSPPSWRSVLTAETPGTDAAVRATSGSTGDQPSCAVITCDAAMRASSVPLVSCRRPLAITVTAVTSITPIISALAVTAVRPG